MAGWLALIDRQSKVGWIPLVVRLGASALLLNAPRHLEESRTGRASLDRLAAAIRPHVGPQGPCLPVFDGPTARECRHATGGKIHSRVCHVWVRRT